MDTAGINKFYSLMMDKRVLFDYVFDVLANRYTATFLEQNLSTFSISDADYRDFVRYVQSKNIVIDNRQLIASKSVVYNDLKALLYKYHLGESGYYKALNLNDNMIKQALTSLQ
jgi:carboxyl-terminal processing protease